MITAKKPKCRSCSRDLSFVGEENCWICHICTPLLTEDELFDGMTLSERIEAGKDLRSRGIIRKWSWE